jgi:transcriptional regulator with XRE-family HTH domain
MGGLETQATGAPTMDGAELKRIRKSLRLSTTELARAFGHAGKRETISKTIRTYEAGMRPVPEYLARLATMFLRHGVPPEFLAEPERPPEPPKGKLFRTRAGHGPIGPMVPNDDEPGTWTAPQTEWVYNAAGGVLPSGRPHPDDLVAEWED